MPILATDVCASFSASDARLDCAAAILTDVRHMVDDLLDTLSDPLVNDWHIAKGAQLARTLEQHLGIWVTQTNLIQNELVEVFHSDVEPETAAAHLGDADQSHPE